MKMLSGNLTYWSGRKKISFRNSTLHFWHANCCVKIELENLNDVKNQGSQNDYQT